MSQKFLDAMTKAPAPDECVLTFFRHVVDSMRATVRRRARHRRRELRESVMLDGTCFAVLQVETFAEGTTEIEDNLLDLGFVARFTMRSLTASHKRATVLVRRDGTHGLITYQ